MSLLKYLLVFLLIISLTSCYKEEIKPGYYLLTQMGTLSLEGWFAPEIGYLVVNKDYTLTLPYVNEIEERSTDNADFTYTIKGSKITLTQGNFIKEYSIKSNGRNHIKIDLEEDGSRSLNFTLQHVELAGKWEAGGFSRTPEKDWEGFHNHTAGLFEGVLLDFSKNNEQLTLKPELAFYLIGDSVNTTYNYVNKGHSLVLNNEKNEYEIDFFYDGMLHLLPEDEYINRIDLGLLNRRIKL